MKHALIFVLMLSALCMCASAQMAPPTSGIDGDRREAMDLYEQNKFEQALPLLEKVAAARPDDMVVAERLAMVLNSTAMSITDPEKRKTQRKRARELFLKVKNSGGKSDLTDVALELLPEDGSDPASFSSNAEVEKAMREGETAFGRGDYKAARDSYLRALLIDPNLYHAALYVGDTYFGEKKWGSAAEWFARAVQINPDAETAYRYWGDSLMMMDKMREARAKFIEAIICEPYSKRTWSGVSKWVQRAGLAFAPPRIQTGAAVSQGTTGADGKQNINITIDPSTLGKKDDAGAGAAWMIYGISRSLWQTEKFKKEYPNEKAYRHSLKEEVDALQMAASAIDEKKKQPKNLKKLDPSIRTLVELDQKGLLEPYVLISAPDQGIAQDYVAYRSKNREKLRQYLDEYVVPRMN